MISEIFYVLFFPFKSLKSGVYFIPKAHLHLDGLPFSCLKATVLVATVLDSAVLGEKKRFYRQLMN